MRPNFTHLVFGSGFNEQGRCDSRRGDSVNESRLFLWFQMIHRNLSARAWVLIYATLCGLMLQSVHGEKIPLEVFRGERLQIEK